MAEKKEENKGQTDRLTWSTPAGWTEADQSVVIYAGFLSNSIPQDPRWGGSCQKPFSLMGPVGWGR